MKAIHAVYEKGVFRPTEPVDLPDGCEVTVEPLPSPERAAETLSAHQRRIHELLGQPTDTRDPGLSARHDEHQP
jgi:predicted DNA-binding antitoxin AbrB/MazE fold protein